MTEADVAKALRDMVDGLVDRGVVTDARVIEALRAVPRHAFLPAASIREAYADRAVVTKFEDGRPSSSASQPSIVAHMLEQLDVGSGHSVLEIGTGTGYNAALLAHLVGDDGRVVTIDIASDLVDDARQRLARTAAPVVDVICGDGADGWTKEAPYDRIIVTAGSSDLAPAWWEQLAPGGLLVLPISLAGVQQCVAFQRTGDHLESRSVCDCGFMPLQGTMAQRDGHFPIPGHPGVAVDTGRGLADVEVVGRTLLLPSPVVDIGVRATPAEVLGSLRRWLAFREPALARLSCTGTAEDVARSAVPDLLEIPLDRSRRHRETPVLIDKSGLAALDRTNRGQAGTPGPDDRCPLGVRAFGSAAPRRPSRRVDQGVGFGGAAGDRSGTDRGLPRLRSRSGGGRFRRAGRTHDLRRHTVELQPVNEVG